MIATLNPCALCTLLHQSPVKIPATRDPALASVQEGTMIDAVSVNLASTADENASLDTHRNTFQPIYPLTDPQTNRVYSRMAPANHK